jgi:N-acetyl-anhydromuramyl-L-alanine amidase AmpD
VRKTFHPEIRNYNAIGLSCVGAGQATGSEPTSEQQQAVKVLAFALCDIFAIPFTQVVGHGEIQSNRHKTEGTKLAEEIRSW